MVYIQVMQVYVIWAYHKHHISERKSGVSEAVLDTLALNFFLNFSWGKIHQISKKGSLECEVISGFFRLLSVRIDFRMGMLWSNFIIFWEPAISGIQVIVRSHAADALVEREKQLL